MSYLKYCFLFLGNKRSVDKIAHQACQSCSTCRRGRKFPNNHLFFSQNYVGLCVCTNFKPYRKSNFELPVSFSQHLNKRMLFSSLVCFIPKERVIIFRNARLIMITRLQVAFTTLNYLRRLIIFFFQILVKQYLKKLSATFRFRIQIVQITL